MRLRCLCILNVLLWNLLLLDFWMYKYVPSMMIINWSSRSAISFVAADVWWCWSTAIRLMCPSPRFWGTKSFNNAFETSWMIRATTRLFFIKNKDAKTAFDIPRRILARNTAKATRTERIWEFLIEMMQLRRWLNWSKSKVRKLINYREMMNDILQLNRMECLFWSNWDRTSAWDAEESWFESREKSVAFFKR